MTQTHLADKDNLKKTSHNILNNLKSIKKLTIYGETAQLESPESGGPPAVVGLIREEAEKLCGISESLEVGVREQNSGQRTGLGN